MSDITLYHADYSTCSQKVRMTLAEKKLAYRSIPLSFRKEEQLAPSYLKLNPNGVVPTLVHGNDVIVDSSCIIEYLDEVFDAEPLRPATAAARAKMRAWLRYMEEVPTKAIRTPSFNDVFLPALRLVKSKKAFSQSASRRTLRKGFYKKMNDGQGFQDADVKDSIRQLRDTVQRMNSELETGHWIMGEKFTLVDIGLAPLIDRAADMEMHFLWNDLPNVIDWIHRVQSRSSFVAAFYKGSRLSQRFEFKLSMRSTKKQNRNSKLSDYLEEY